jgi:hypothetical protein
MVGNSGRPAGEIGPVVFASWPAMWLFKLYLLHSTVWYRSFKALSLSDEGVWQVQRNRASKQMNWEDGEKLPLMGLNHCCC